jgi:cytochrome c oxidase cbb3-type subunit III
MAEYENKVLDHEVDGIREYDNPLPGWLMGILWGALVFSALYLGFYALAFGPASMEAEYRSEAISERAKLQAYFNDNPLVPPTSKELLAGAKEPKVIAAGRARFAKTCASCHGDQAQGLIGPNLTDSHWLHGGKVSQIFNTVVKGVPAKGMPPWGRAIPPEELSALVSFIRSVQGTKPSNPKAPEGKLEAPEALEGN